MDFFDVDLIGFRGFYHEEHGNRCCLEPNSGKSGLPILLVF